MMTHIRTCSLVLLLAGALGLMLGQASPLVTPLEETESPAQDATASQESQSAPVQPPNVGQLPMPSGAQVAVIRVEDLIYDFTLDSLQRRIDRAIASGATLIVIELDTYGGQVTSALEISKYIKNLNVPTVAWVNDKAYSAGTMIAAACDQIIMSDTATLGDSAPVVQGQDLAPTERAKALSPILEEYRDDAQRHGYDYALFHAMCELGIEVYQVEHKTTGQTRFVNQSDFAVMVQGADPDAVATGSTGGVIGKVMGTNNASPSLEVATAADRAQWKMVKKIHDGRSLLTMNQTRAADAGISKAIVRNETELQQYLGAQTVSRVSQTWSEDLAQFLTHPAVRGILIVALLLGGYAELQAPGVGLPGGVAVVALLLLVGAPFVIGLAEVWHLLLLLAGMVLLVIELMFTPTFGLLGIAGILMMLTSLVIMVLPMGSPFFNSSSATHILWGQFLSSATTVLISLIVSFVGFFFLTKYFGSIPILNRLILPDVQPAGMPTPTERVSGDEVFGQNVKVGDTGQAITTLHPSGQALIDGQPIDVVAASGWVDQGTKIQITEIHGNRIVVEAM